MLQTGTFYSIIILTVATVIGCGHTQEQEPGMELSAVAVMHERAEGGYELRLQIPIALGEKVSYDSPQPDGERKGVGVLNGVTVDVAGNLYFEVLVTENDQPTIVPGILASEITAVR